MVIEANYNDGGLSAAAPFYNDWDETKKYLQMLFTPGRALQARELTQLQTMLQVQVDRFGSHIFENGSPVGGGQTTVHTDVAYIRVDKDSSYTNVTDFSTLKGETLTEFSTGVSARVIHVDETTTDTDPYPVLFVQYTSTSLNGSTTTFSDSSELTTAGIGSSSSSSGGDQIKLITSAQATDPSFNAASNGDAYLISIDQGIFFIDGFFVIVDEQSYAPVTMSVNDVRTYTAKPTTRVGLVTTKSVIDINDDSSLGDPANGSPNYAAPGAQRLKFVTTLTEKQYTESVSTVANVSSSDFVELIRVVSGAVRKQVKYPVYSDIENTFARRTHDESGNYTVKAFRANARESSRRRTLSVPTLAQGTAFTDGEYVSATTGSSSSSSGGASAIATVVDWDSNNNNLVVDLLTSAEFVAGDYVVNDDGDTGGFVTAATTEHFDVVLEPGKAYIFGREFETITPEIVTFPKARGESESSLESTNCAYGNYVICDEIDGLFDINEQETVFLYSADNSSSSSSSSITGDIGTANIKHVLYDTTNNYYRLYLYDIKINPGETFNLLERIESETTGAIARIDDTNGKESGVTRLFNKTSNKSIWQLPSVPVQGSLSSITYYYRLYQTGTFNASGEAVLSMPATSTGDDYLSAATTGEKRENYIVVNTSTNTDISANIDTVTLNAGADQSTISFSSGSSSGQSFAVISVVKSTSAARTKTLIEDYEIPVNLSLDANNRLDLGIADVNAVVSVLDTGNGNADVTSSFVLDTGQRDNIYDYARLTLDNGASVTGPFTVTVDYFEHSGSGPLTINSYSGIDYDSYPVYTSPNDGVSYTLRDCVDFRPIKDNQYNGSSSSSSSPDTLDLAKVICPYDSLFRTFVSTHNFYKGRIDKLALTREREFKVISGVPAFDPESPVDESNSMTLYEVEIPPYTGDVSKIRLKYRDNRRFTMRDIGRLRDRISNVEYYTSLSLLEKDAESLTVKDSNGAERFKNGILVDAFNGHKIGNVNDRDYACSMDFTEGILRPPFKSDNVSLDYDSGNSSGIEKNGDQITLAATTTTEPFVEQPLASTCISVNPFNVASWMGNMDLTPDSDTWMDTTTRPNVQVNYEGNADAWEFLDNNASAMQKGFSTEWDDWETVWMGRTPTRRSKLPDRPMQLYVQRTPWSVQSVGKNIAKQTRTGTKTYYDVDTVNETLGERVVNVSIIPYMRAKTITVSATGMKPNTTVYPFFDDTDVSAYCSPSSIQTNAFGDATVTFNLPGGIFESGSKVFRLMDDPNNLLADAITTAEAVYTSKGMLEEKEQDVVSTKTVKVRRQEVTKSRFVKGAGDLVGVGVGTVTDSLTLSERNSIRKAPGWNDPIAQSFLVDPANFPHGIFLSSVDLFFRTKDENLPVTLDLRPTVNGYPSASRVIPFSTVTKKPSEVNTTNNPDPSDSSTYTRFAFDSYVYLAPGEYHVTCRSNSDLYCAYIAEIGQTQIGSTNRITEQPYAGVFFKSQNANTWSPDQTVDLTFRLNRCKFSKTTPGIAIFENEASSSVFDVCNILTNDLETDGTKIKYEYRTTNLAGTTGNYEEIRTHQNLFQSEQMELDTIGDFNFKATFTTTDEAVSPIIDDSRTSVTAIENVINNSTTGETDPIANLTSGAKARYITRRVNLREGFSAKDLKVFLTGNIPEQADVKVYYKVLAAEDDTPFDDRPWVELTETDGLEKESFEGEFLEYEFESTSTDSNGDTTVVYGDYEDFQTYAIKIVLLSSSTSAVPQLKDMRSIAVL